MTKDFEIFYAKNSGEKQISHLRTKMKLSKPLLLFCEAMGNIYSLNNRDLDGLGK